MKPFPEINPANLDANRPAELTVTHESLQYYAHNHDYPQSYTNRCWSRMQVLYAARIRYQETGQKTEKVFGRRSVTVVTTPLVFRSSLPIPLGELELPETWVDWSMTLDDLEIQSLGHFVVQLETTPDTNKNVNPYRSLLGRGSSKGMAKLLGGFFRSVDPTQT